MRPDHVSKAAVRNGKSVAARLGSKLIRGTPVGESILTVTYIYAWTDPIPSDSDSSTKRLVAMDENKYVSKVRIERDHISVDELLHVATALGLGNRYGFSNESLSIEWTEC